MLLHPFLVTFIKASMDFRTGLSEFDCFLQFYLSYFLLSFVSLVVVSLFCYLLAVVPDSLLRLMKNVKRKKIS